MIQTIRSASALALCSLLLLAPTVAFACPVCFSAQNEENRAAFVAMTAFLTLLPLGMLGLGLGWAWRRMQRLDGTVPAPVVDEAEAPAAHTSR
jgi:Ca2+/H+ antiporter